MGRGFLVDLDGFARRGQVVLIRLLALCDRYWNNLTSAFLLARKTFLDKVSMVVCD